MNILGAQGVNWFMLVMFDPFFHGMHDHFMTTSK